MTLFSLPLSSLFCSLCRVFSALSSTNPFTLSLSFHSVLISLLLLPSLCSALSLSIFPFSLPLSSSFSTPFVCLLTSVFFFMVYPHSSYFHSDFFSLIPSLFSSILSSLLLSLPASIFSRLLCILFSHLSSSHSSPFSFFSLVSAPVPSSLSLPISLSHYIPLSNPPFPFSHPTFLPHFPLFQYQSRHLRLRFHMQYSCNKLCIFFLLQLSSIAAHKFRLTLPPPSHLLPLSSPLLVHLSA